MQISITYQVTSIKSFIYLFGFRFWQKLFSFAGFAFVVHHEHSNGGAAEVGGFAEVFFQVALPAPVKIL